MQRSTQNPWGLAGSYGRIRDPGNPMFAAKSTNYERPTRQPSYQNPGLDGVPTHLATKRWISLGLQLLDHNTTVEDTEFSY